MLPVRTRTQNTLRSAGLVLLAAAPFLVYSLVMNYLDSSSAAKPSILNLLIYPNAHNPDTVIAEDSRWLGQVTTISFTTSDSPESVAAWYSSELEKQGWWKDPVSTSNNLTFLFFETCGTRPCRIEVEIAVPRNDETQVELKVY